MPWPAIGGTELATLRIAEGVRPAGFDSVMLCREDSPEVRTFFLDHGFAAESYDAAPFESGRPLDYLRATWRLAGALRRLRIDIVHCADVLAGDFAVPAARLAGCRVVCQVRNRYDWITPFQRLWLLLLHRLVFVSEHTREHFGRKARDLLPVKGRIGTVIYDGIALPPAVPPHEAGAAALGHAELRRELAIPEGVKVVGMVARISRQKDHLSLVAAAERVVAAYPDVCFLLVGGCGPAQHELDHGVVVFRRIAESPAHAHFVYAGFRRDVMRIVAILDIFALPTHFEGLPLVLLEAMAHARPVVATAVDGIPEVVQHGVTGFLHEHENAEQLAQQLLELLRDPQRARSMGDASKRRVETVFGEARFAADMVKLYSSLAPRRRPGA